MRHLSSKEPREVPWVNSLQKRGRSCYANAQQRAWDSHDEEDDDDCRHCFRQKIHLIHSRQPLRSKIDDLNERQSLQTGADRHDD